MEHVDLRKDAPKRAGPDAEPRLERLAWLLDNSIQIPGLGYRIGIDPLLGLIPGVGDFVGGALSVYILYEAARMGVSRPLLMRMGFNVLIEVVVGTVPILGDLFDAGWKANARNVRLLQEHLKASQDWRPGGGTAYQAEQG